MAKKKSFENIISNILGEPVSNLCHAFYDQYVEANVRFRSKAGMKELIIRRQLGKCCKWCADLAGIYTPENAPADIYRRHDNCKCMVTYKDESGYTDVWTKKEFESQKEARKAREKEILETNGEKKHSNVYFDLFRKKRLKEEINRIKREARNEGRQYADTLNPRKNYKGRSYTVEKAKSVKINGRTYRPDGRNVVFDDNSKDKNLRKKWEKEKKTAQLLTNTFGGKIEMIPRVLNPKHVRTADYKWNGVFCDRKAPTGKSDRTIPKNVYEAKGQARIIALELTDCDIPLNKARNIVGRLFTNPYYDDFMDVVIIIKNNEVLNYYERI